MTLVLLDLGYEKLTQRRKGAKMSLALHICGFYESLYVCTATLKLLTWQQHR
ncbi:MAG: hypothetical protein AB3A66_16315 [Nodularia sp. CChRGM 3473]